VSKDNARVCECVDGYFGKFCENSFRACLTRPCQGAATCVDLGRGSYRCLCPPGLSGRHCETRHFSEVSRRVSDKEFLLVKEVSVSLPYFLSLKVLDTKSLVFCVQVAAEVAGLSSQQVALVVVLSVLIPVVALAGVASVMLLRRRREVERKEADHMARQQNEANLRASGQRPEMIHNRLRADNHEYATVSHDYAKLNTNRAFLDADNRLSKASLESQQCCQPSMW